IWRKRAHEFRRALSLGTFILELLTILDACPRTRNAAPIVMKHHIFADASEGLNVVAIGGGNGLSTLLSGLKHYVGARESEPVWIANLSAIVAVTDDGGSSGRLRDELNMPPPGDIRNCMVALSEDSRMLSRLFQHRFSGDGDLSGHNFGNLFL